MQPDASRLPQGAVERVALEETPPVPSLFGYSEPGGRPGSRVHLEDAQLPPPPSMADSVNYPTIPPFAPAAQVLPVASSFRPGGGGSASFTVNCGTEGPGSSVHFADFNFQGPNQSENYSRRSLEAAAIPSASTEVGAMTTFAPLTSDVGRNYEANGNILPIDDGSDPINGSLHWKAQRALRDARVQASVVILGCFVFAFSSLVPIASALMIGRDQTWTFWLGHDLAIEVALFSVIVPTVFAALGLIVLKRANPDHISRHLVSVFAALFALLFGAGLVFAGYGGHQAAIEVAGQLDHHCATGALQGVDKLSALIMESTKLQNIRDEPGCSGKANIIGCGGWFQNKYSDYLRFLEDNNRCGPVCASSGNFPSLNSAPRIGDQVVVNDGSHRAQQAFKRDPTISWTPHMRDMLGRTHRVMDGFASEMPYADVSQNVLSADNTGMTAVGVPSPDGSQGGVWYFPAAVVEKVTLPGRPEVQERLLFAAKGGTTDMPCYPIISAQLRATANTAAGGIFWQGVVFIVGAIIVGALPGITSAFVR